MRDNRIAHLARYFHRLNVEVIWFRLNALEEEKADIIEDAAILYHGNNPEFYEDFIYQP